MSKTILLAVDAARHVPESHVAAAVAMTRELSRDTGDQVIVVHVHEFAVGRFGRLQVDCAEGQGESLVAEIVADLRSVGSHRGRNRPRGRFRARGEKDPGRW